VIAWTQHDGSENNIWVRHYSFSLGWGWTTAVTIDHEDYGDAVSPHVAINNNHAVCVWRQYVVDRYCIFTSFGTNDPILGEGWDDPPTPLLYTLGYLSGNCHAPRVAINADGDAVVVWYDSLGGNNNLWGAIYNNDVGYWNFSERIDADYATDAINPKIAMKGDNAIAVWQQTDGGVSRIWASRCVAGDGWGIPGPIDTGVGDSESPQIAINSDGAAIAVWQNSVGGVSQIMANRFAPIAGWGTVKTVSNAAPGFSLTDISMNQDGFAIAIWGTYLSPPSVWTKSYFPY
jgi:hypothetical protein